MKTIRRTKHFDQRAKERGFNLYDWLYLLHFGEVKEIKGGRVRVSVGGASMVAAPKPYGYLLITIYEEGVE